MINDRCIHGIEKDNCYYCNGLEDKKNNETKLKDNELSELKDKYDILKAKFKSFKDIWTEEEIFTVYEALKDITKQNKVKFYYKLSLQLERTKNAIAWMYSHIFSDKIDLHRGQEVINFRLKLKIK